MFKWVYNSFMLSNTVPPWYHLIYLLDMMNPFADERENEQVGQFHNCQSWSFITVHGQF